MKLSLLLLLLITTILFLLLPNNIATPLLPYHHPRKQQGIAVKEAMGIEKELLKAGNGTKPARGQTVTVQCTGYGQFSFLLPPWALTCLRSLFGAVAWGCWILLSLWVPGVYILLHSAEIRSSSWNVTVLSVSSALCALLGLHGRLAHPSRWDSRAAIGFVYLYLT